MKRNPFRFFFTLVLSLFFLSCPSLPSKPFSASAKEEGLMSVSRPVKVGVLDIDSLFILDEGKTNADGSLSVIGGYGYALLNGLSNYSGLSYSYYSETLTDSLAHLKDGTIDVVFPLVRTEEREKDYSFSDEECLTDYGSLYIRKAETQYYYDDVATLNEIASFGYVDGFYTNTLFSAYLSGKGVAYPTEKMKSYPSLSALKKGLLAGEIEAAVSDSLSSDDALVSIAQFPSFNTYFAFTKDSDYVAKFNDAFLQLENDSVSFLSDLFETYYLRGKRRKAYTREEHEYIAARNQPLTVVGDPSFYPFESSGKNGYEGIYPDILKLLTVETGLQFTYQKTADLSASWEAIRNKEADLISGVYINKSVEEQYAILPTVSFYNEQNVLVVKTGFTGTIYSAISVAVNKNYIGLKAYLRTFYPKWTLVECENSSACLSSLKEGKSEAAIYNSFLFDYEGYRNRDSSLQILTGFTAELPVGYGVSTAISSPALLQSDTVGLKKESTFADFYQANQALVISLMVLLILLLLGLSVLITVLFVRNHTRKEVESKNQELALALASAREAERARDRYDQVFANLNLGIFQIETKKLSPSDAKIVYINSAAIDFFDLREENGEVKSASLSELRSHVSDQDLTSIDSYLHELRDGVEKKPIAIRYLRGNQMITLAFSAVLLPRIREEDPRTVQMTFFDMTDRQVFENGLLRKAQLDQATGIFNKKTTEDLEIQYLSVPFKNPIALFILDVDNLKELNDRLGHVVGDSVLKAFAEELASLVGKKGIYGRIGGDEFSVLYKDASDPKELEAILKELKDFSQHYETPFSVSAGVKIVSYSPDLAFHDLYVLADRLMYQSKQRGKGEVTVG
jgi:diguanylate cyclase (GGDEF)-like protein